ncbi:MAG: phage tail protein, partial [Methylomonas sp.]
MYMVEIRFDNVTYPWWQQVDVRASVDDVAATVGLAVTRSGTGGRLGVSENTVIQVMVDGMLAATVRPDVIRRRVDAQSHSISIDARSLGRELIDTQYSQTLSGLKLGEIVERLGKTFGVPVVVAADTKPVKDFAMQAESPATALINAARVANLLLYATPDGGIKLAEPDKAAPVAELRYGLNIAGYEVVDEYRLRFSEYLVKGYDHVGNKALRGAVKDDEINYFRPLHII